MRRLLLTLVFVLIAQPGFASFYAQTATGIDGKPAPLSAYKGKVALVVNTASQCGFTPQYKDLEALYKKYSDKGFVVLGFPSNDFGAQEPGSNAEIAKFCERKFKVTFPLFSKAPVSGAKRQPVYAFLSQNATPAGDPEWNFEKFLVDTEGKVVARFRSSVSPSAPEVAKAVEGQLAKVAR